MSASATWLRRLASAPLVLASALVPASHREWLDGMRVEVAYIESDAVALRWALGCVVASLKWRARVMLTLNGRISRPVLVLEWLMCFGPLTLMWIVSLLYVRWGGLPTDLAVKLSVGVACATLGPVALLVALMVTLSKQSQAMTRIARWLPVAAGAMCLLQLLDIGKWFRFDPGTFVLLSLLPLLGCLHVMHLSKPSSPETAPA